MSKGKNSAMPQAHANVVIDLNGMPYLLGEYMDKCELQQIDRSAIRSEILIDDSDAMRAVIDVSINDIGKMSDGRLNIVGNNSKQRKLLDIISKNANVLNHQLPVLRSGIMMRVNYRLENNRTGHTLGSMAEDLLIPHRNYFLDINPKDIDDNAIIVNFSNSMVSTINNFTHGRDRMLLRITSIQMFYVGVANGPNMPRIKQSLVSHEFNQPCGVKPGSTDSYFYHDQMQHHHFLGDPNPGHGGYGHEDVNAMCPPTWASFNRFYHFDNECKDAVLHNQEIYDPLCSTFLVPCGNITVNQTFIVNPGHRLIFKFSVWKNDLTVISNMSMIAKALKAECFHMHDWFRDKHHEVDHDHLVEMLYHERQRNEQQEQMIRELMNKIGYLEALIQASIPGQDPNRPVNPLPKDPPLVTPVPGGNNEGCGCDDCETEHQEINDRIDQLADRVDAEDIDPMPADVLEKIFHEVKDEQ